jgi:hypothetical protein
MTAPQWFEAQIRYEKTLDNGMNKKITETYLVDSLSFTESESKTIEEISPFISGDFTIHAIKRSNISEVFNDGEEEDPYYKVKVDFITLDDKSGLEKRTPSYFLLKAPSMDKAVPLFIKYMSGTMTDYEIVKIEKTAILDVIAHDSRA